MLLILVAVLSEMIISSGGGIGMGSGYFLRSMVENEAIFRVKTRKKCINSGPCVCVDLAGRSLFRHYSFERQK